MPLDLDRFTTDELGAFARAQTALAKQGDPIARELAAYAGARKNYLHASALGYEALMRRYQAACDAIFTKLPPIVRWR